MAFRAPDSCFVARARPDARGEETEKLPSPRSPAILDGVSERNALPRVSERKPRPAGALLALTVLVMTVTLSGCPCAQAITEASPGLRWWLFSNFGASKV